MKYDAELYTMTVTENNEHKRKYHTTIFSYSMYNDKELSCRTIYNRH